MIEIENIINVKDGLVSSIELERFFPIVHNKIVQEHPEFHYSRRLIKIDRFMESIYNYSINTDALEANDDLFIPRVTFHKADPSKTYTIYYNKAVSIKKAKNISTSMALKHLEDELRLIKTD